MERRLFAKQWGVHIEGWGTYDAWMEKEGIPVHQAEHGIEDITELPRRPWARLGGKGCFIELETTKQAAKGLYVLEIPPGGAVEPERHLYDELLYIVRGRGLAEVWQEGQNKVSFEWGEASLFGVPLNAWHRFVNGGREPVLIFGQSSAPILMNTLRDVEFIFNCPYNFTDRFGGQADYFVSKENKARRPTENFGDYWVTNFIPNFRASSPAESVAVNDPLGRGAGYRQIAPGGWQGIVGGPRPAGIYPTAHYHGPGAVFMIVEGKGYTLFWDKKYGIHPYQDGCGDKVARFDWKVNSIFGPQRDCFHPVHATGKIPARYFASTGGGITIEQPTLRLRPVEQIGLPYLNQSIRVGGTVITQEDMDPEIHRIYEEECRKNGVKMTTPRPVYRTDPVKLFT